MPWYVSAYTPFFGIFYGAVSIFVAQFLTPERKAASRISELDDPYAIPEPEPQGPPLSYFVAVFVVSTILGCLVAGLYLLGFVNLYPEAHLLAFPLPDDAEPLSPRVFVTSSALFVMVLSISSLAALRMWRTTGVLGLMAGGVLATTLLLMGSATTPSFGQALFGQPMVERAFMYMGHTDGRPEDWTVAAETRRTIRKLQVRYPKGRNGRHNRLPTR